MRSFTLFSCTLLWLACLATKGYAQKTFEAIRSYPAEEAVQGVAVDARYIYAIGSRAIGKYDKKSGQRLKQWKGDKAGPIRHLDSGVIKDGKLYAAHSNYPDIPMTSSVEIWDSRTLAHIGSHSFGIQWGSLTWLDWHKGSWWGVFAHYKEFADQIHQDSRWTSLVRFDKQWQVQQSWVFPKEVLDKFGKMSNSGGSWGPDGLLYISGHDLPELYVLKLPRAGSVLELAATVKVDSEGQGMAWDRSRPGTLYTIQRRSARVVASKSK
jgi:hypothetical protein